MSGKKRGRKLTFSYQEAVALKKQHKASGLSLKAFCQQQQKNYETVWRTLQRYSLIHPRSYNRTRGE